MSANSTTAPMVPLDNPVVLNIMDLYGVMLVGTILSAALWGISCMQMFIYFVRYGSDRMFLKVLVVGVWTLDTVIEVLTIQSLFPALILKWGSLVEVTALIPSLIHRTWLSYVLAFIVQMFFIYRIYQFSKGGTTVTRMFLAAVAILALWQIVGVILYTIWTVGFPTVTQLRSSDRIIAIEISSRVVSAVVDVAIACTMTYLLANRQGASFLQSRQLIQRLIIMSINTGTWTAIVAVLDFSLIAARSDLLFAVFEWPLGTLYVNTLLANLNARQYIRNGNGSSALEYHSGSYELGTRGKTSSTGRPARVSELPARATASQGDPIAIHIQTATNRHADQDSAHDSALGYAKDDDIKV